MKVVGHKTCTKCKTEKPKTAFSKHKSMPDGLQCQCKQCNSEDTKKRVKGPRTELSCSECEKAVQWPYRKVCSAECRETRDHRVARETERLKYEADPEKHRAASRQWAKDNPAKVLEKKRNWRETNREKDRAGRRRRHDARWNTDTQYRLAMQLRTRLRRAVEGSWKSGSAVADLGCSIAELKLHLERQFDANMTWENYGTYWHIDHVLPLAHFDLTDREQFLRAVHWSNLQPLYWRDNLVKKDRILEQHQHLALVA